MVMNLSVGMPARDEVGFVVAVPLSHRPRTRLLATGLLLAAMLLLLGAVAVTVGMERQARASATVACRC